MALTIVEVLQTIMDRVGLDQRSMAELFGVTSSYISQILSGQKTGGDKIYEALQGYGFYRLPSEIGQPVVFEEGAVLQLERVAVADAVRAIRESLSMTQAEFSAHLGISQPALSHIELGRTKSLDSNIIDQIARLSGTRLRMMQDGTVEFEEGGTATKEQLDRLKRVPTLSENVTAKGIERNTPKNRSLKVYKPDTDLYIPYYSQAVPAGYPNPVVNDSVLRLNMTRYLDGSAIYEVVGDSMIDAGIEQGCRVIVRLTKEFNPNGDIIMALYNGEPTVKGIVQDDSGIWLVPLNHDKAYEPWFVSSSDQFECIGVVVDIWDRPKKNDVRKVLSEYRQRTQASKE